MNIENKNRTTVKIYRTKNGDIPQDDGYIEAEPSYLIGIMWELTRDAWAVTGKDDAERRLQRHIVRFVRRKG